MRLVYLANSRIPTEKAHGIQIMKTCEALARAGVSLTLIVPKRKNNIATDPFVYYQVDPIFDIKFVNTWDLVRFGPIGFIIQSITYALSAYQAVRRISPACVYGRDEYSLLVVGYLTKIPSYFEAHMGRWNIVISLLARKACGIFPISYGLKKYFIEKGVDEKKIYVSPDAVDAELFVRDISVEDARKQLDLPRDKSIILYSGHLYDWKGAQTIVEIAQGLPDNYIVVVVGGTDEDVSRYRNITRNIKNILYIGKKPYNQIPIYLRAADILILPNSGKEQISREFTSPMKLFEYMASGRPIIASNLSSIKEVLSDSMVFFAEADNAQSFLKTIEHVSKNGSEAANKSLQARDYVVRSHTWNTRAASVIQIIKQNP
jgi:glycosyltransferase involved in cell wall biosynthesis